MGWDTIRINQSINLTRPVGAMTSAIIGTGDAGEYVMVHRRVNISNIAGIPGAMRLETEIPALK